LIPVLLDRASVEPCSCSSCCCALVLGGIVCVCSL
jgi:hypothetical protein